MFNKLIFIIVTFISSFLSANDNLLTLQQQVERLQREVTDISKSVYSSSNLENNDSNLVSNLSSIDLRIYDLEKDVKTLNSNFEDILFQLDDISKKLNEFENTILKINNSLSDFNQNKNFNSNKVVESKNNNIEDENTLGTLKISTDQNETSNNKTLSNDKNVDYDDSSIDLSPEDQFQLAFQNIRNKNYEDAKNSFYKFIDNNPENQLSGSAHYWLGELYVLEKKYRDAALIFAEGYQKFPKSIKAPDMLYKLSQTLFEVEKNKEGCNTMKKFIDDYPKHKLVEKTKKHIIDQGCDETNE